MSADNVLDQADALMRRRTFVLGGEAEPAAAEREGHAGEQGSAEDIPVLTDVVGDAADTPETLAARNDALGSAPVASRTPELERVLRERLNQLLQDRQAALAQEIEAWLDEQMPQLVIRAMDGITDHLVSLLANRAKDELLPRLEAMLKPLDAPEGGAE